MVPSFKSYAVNDDHGGPIRDSPLLAVIRPKPLVYRTTSFADLSSSSLRIAGRSFETTYNLPFTGSTAAPLQLAPPLLPGISTVLRRPGGVNSPSLREL